MLPRKAIAGMLAFSLAFLSPGVPCYQALAAQVGAAPKAVVVLQPAAPMKRSAAFVARLKRGAAPLLRVLARSRQAPEALPVQAEALLGPSAVVMRQELEAPPREGVSPQKFLSRTLVAAALGLSLALSSAPGPIRAEPTPPPSPAARAPAAATLQPASAGMTARVEGTPLELGGRGRLVLTVRNGGKAPMRLNLSRAALAGLFPEELELQGQAPDPIVLSPGQTRELSFEFIAFGSGELKIGGELLGTAVAPVSVAVKSPLTPDWEQKGFRGPKDVVQKSEPEWSWAFALPLLVLAVLAAERFLRSAPAPAQPFPEKEPVLSRAEAGMAVLEDNLESLPDREFYAEYYKILSSFLVDYHGLPVKERHAAGLAADLKASRKLGSGQLEVAAGLARRAEMVRFGGGDASADRRRRDLRSLGDLTRSVAGRPGGEAPRGASGLLGILGFLPIEAASLHFGNPWALILFVPLTAFILWKWRGRPAGLLMPQALPAALRPSLRQRLAFLPNALRVVVLGLLILYMAQPQLGVVRQEAFIASTDTILEIDSSGSMASPYSAQGGKSRLQAAKESAKAYAVEQRRGGGNRLGLFSFAENAEFEVMLTFDTDAFLAQLEGVAVRGGTAIGRAVLAGAAQFVEDDLKNLDDSGDPRVKEAKRILAGRGLRKALAYLNAQPDLAARVLRSERQKVLVVFSDGDSNVGISPLEAARIAKKLGIKIYTVGIASDAGGPGVDEATLKKMAEITGARYFRAADAEALTQALLEINALVKIPSKVLAVPMVRDLRQELAILALLLVGLELTLSSTWLRVLQGLAFLSLPLMSQPAALSDGNLLFHQGRYGEAAVRYARALERYPDMAELYFNMGNAYLSLGEAEKAARCYQEFLARSGDSELAAQAHYNRGLAALLQKDLAAARDAFKQALRLNPGDADARWNLDLVNQLLKKKQKNHDGKKRDGENREGEDGRNRSSQEHPDPRKGEPSAQSAAKPSQDQGKTGLEDLQKGLQDQEKDDSKPWKKGGIPTEAPPSLWGLLALPLLAPGFLGSGVALASPAWLWAAAILLPIVAWLLAYGIHKKIQAAKSAAPAVAPASFGAWRGARLYKNKAALLLLGVGLLCLAAARPMGGQQDVAVSFGGNDVLLDFDLSLSTRRSELGHFKAHGEGLTRFVSRLQGADRVGLILFSGTAKTAASLSMDYGTLQYKLQHLESEAERLEDGSKLSAAVRQAIAAFVAAKDLGDREWILVLISDGDVPDYDVEAALKSVRHASRLVIYTIGMGSPEGSRIKVPSRDGKSLQDLVDSTTDKPAVTFLNEKNLRRLAESTGGAYFRAEGEGSMERILAQVAGRHEGRQWNVLRSPRDIGVWLVAPAFLLLLLESVLGTKLKGEDDSAQDKNSLLHGGVLLGLGTIPLHFWPMIFPFALLTAALGVLLWLDWRGGGSVMRGLRRAWQRRRSGAEGALLKDLEHLFDIREADIPSLAAFMKAWSQAGGSRRGELAAEALEDSQLWREKLVAAWLYGSSDESQEKILAALEAGHARYLQSPQAVWERLLENRARFTWLEDGAMPARMMALSRALGAAEAPAAPPRLPWGRRLALLAAALMLVPVLGLAGLSGAKTVQYFQDRAMAARGAVRIFYGEDAYALYDRYADPRIGRLVLPALSRWPLGVAAGDMEAAVEALSHSSDPKAENLMELIFKHASELGLSLRARALMTAALVRWKNDGVWAVLVEATAGENPDPRRLEQAAEMLEAAAAMGGPAAERQILNFLIRAEEPGLQSLAAEALYRVLWSAGKRDQFFPELIGLQREFADKGLANLWLEKILLKRLSSAPMEEEELFKAQDLVQIFINKASSLDAARRKNPSSLLETALELFREEISAVGGAAKAPAPLLAAARNAFNIAAKDLVSEGETEFSGLHARLLKGKVVLPDALDSGFVDYEASPAAAAPGAGVPVYRDAYKLGHLKNLRRAVAAEVRAAVSAKSMTSRRWEYARRSLGGLRALLALGSALGVKEGNLAEDWAADDFNRALSQSSHAFRFPAMLLAALQSEGLVARQGLDRSAGEALWPQAYGPKDLARFEAFFRKLAASGRAWGRGGESSALSWDEKKYLSYLLDAVGSARARHFPAEGPARPADFWEGLERAGEESLALARLSVACQIRKKDAAFQGQALRWAMGWAGKPQARPALGDLEPFLDDLFNAAEYEEQLALLAEAGRLGPGGRPAALLRKKLDEAVAKAFSDAAFYFPAHSLEALARKQHGYTRLQIRIFMTRLREAADALAQEQGRLSQLQADELRRMEGLAPRFLELGAQLGMPAGDTAPELTAEEINELLAAGSAALSFEFFKALHEEGLIPAQNSDAGSADNLPGAYSREDLVNLRAFLARTLAAGKGWNYDGSRPPLEASQKAYLEAAIKTVERLIERPRSSPLYGLAGMGFGILQGAAWGASAWLALAAATVYLLCRAYARWKASRPASIASFAAKRSPAQIEKRAGSIELAARRLADSMSWGSALSAFIGLGGVDVADSRPYENGEDARFLDVKTTARLDTPYLKQTGLEKDMPVVVIADRSRSSMVWALGARKSQVIEELAGALMLAAAAAGRKAGSVVFSDKVESWVLPRQGEDSARLMIRRLLAAEPSGKGTDLKAALELALSRLGSRSTVVVVSDFLAEGFASALMALGERHDVRLVRVFDPAELKPLPDVGLVRVQDPESGAVRLADTSDPAWRAAEAAALSRREDNLKRIFSRTSARVAAVSTAGDYWAAFLKEFSK